MPGWKQMISKKWKVPDFLFYKSTGGLRAPTDGGGHMELIYSVVKADQTGVYYTYDPLEALGVTMGRGRPLISCHQAVNTQGQTFLVLPGGKYIKVVVKGSDSN